MKGATLLALATSFGGLSLLAVGGANALTPALHQMVVEDRAWMDAAVFAQLFAIAQASPGPNILMVSAIGWKLDGLAGMLVATLAILVPSSLLALAAGRLVRAQGETRWMIAVRRGLAPVAIGLMLASGLIMARLQDHSVVHWGLTLASAALVATRRVNPFLLLAAAAAIGAIASAGA